MTSNASFDTFTKTTQTLRDELQQRFTRGRRVWLRSRTEAASVNLLGRANSSFRLISWSIVSARNT
jgi:hypothetical protein